MGNLRQALGALAIAGAAAVALPTTSSAATLGSVSGRVVGPDGQGLNRAAVEVTASGFSYQRRVVTDTAGNYRINGLSGGSYLVKFSPPTGVNLFPEYWADKLDAASADRLVLAEGANLAGIDARLRTGGAISGSVVDAGGLPVAGALVSVAGPDTLDAAKVLTDTNGHYIAGRLHAGRYVVSIDPPSGTNLVGTCWLADPTCRTPTYVTAVEGQTVTGINAALGVGAIVTGTVRGPDGGALANVKVTAAAGDVAPGWIANAVTAVDGTYELRGLKTGSFRVRFDAPSGDYVVGIGEIAIAAGTVTPGIDSVLATAGKISGQLVTGVGQPVPATVAVYTAAGALVDVVFNNADGTYVVGKLPTGLYRVAFAPLDSALAVVYFRDAFDAVDADIVTVTAGATTTGIGRIF
ncbi:MAG: collagen binding domain-containing protein [Acidimicrobiia bacterium]